MANAIFVYGNMADSATLSGGDWAPSLPLDNLKTRALHRVARSVDTDPESTVVHIDLAGPVACRAMGIGPTNLTMGYQRRVRAYNDPERTVTIYDSGWIAGATRAPWNTLDWLNPNYWLGTSSWDDPERGMWIIHVLAAPVLSQYWTVEIDDGINPAGHVDLGRLMIGPCFQPSKNFGYQGNGLSIIDNTLRSGTLAGGEHFHRRVNPRQWQCAWDALPQAELHGAVYDFIRATGYDAEVLLIPDADDAQYLHRRAFLATAKRLDALALAYFRHGSTGFEFREIIA